MLLSVLLSIEGAKFLSSFPELEILLINCVFLLQARVGISRVRFCSFTMVSTQTCLFLLYFVSDSYSDCIPSFNSTDAPISRHVIRD